MKYDLKKGEFDIVQRFNQSINLSTSDIHFHISFQLLHLFGSCCQKHNSAIF